MIVIKKEKKDITDYEREEQRRERIHREKLEEEYLKEARYEFDTWNREQERIKEREDRLKKKAEAKADAIDLARERYLEKSGLYRLFHKRLSDKKASKMTKSQINHLYGGVEDGKGKSR